MTLADDILRYGLRVYNPALPVEHWGKTEWLTQRLRAATIVNIQNVADFYYEAIYNPKKKIDDLDHFPMVVPPWKTAFFEYEITPGIQQRVGMPAARGPKMGFLWEDEGDRSCAVKLYISEKPGDVYARQEYAFMWDHDGKLIDKIFSAPSWRQGPGYVFEHNISDVDSLALNASILAVSFCHCKNVTVKEQETPQQLARAFMRRSGGKEPFRHHVLNIDPMKKAIREASPGAGGVGMGNALHICRGHFKDYRESGGLFGKHKGLYWWDMHVKGNAEHGVVDKGYKVKAKI